MDLHGPGPGSVRERGSRARPGLAWARFVAALCVGALATAVAAGAATAGAGVQQDPARADAPLVVSLDFVVPPHTAGAKVRTPATIDTALAADLARRLQRPLATTPAGIGDATAAASADLRITTLEDPGRAPPSMTVVALDYRAAPMAIMRTDSTIRRWEQLRGRSVCVAGGGTHVGDLRDRYAAIEIVHPTLTEALVALRVGECDALVHDSVLLEELLRLPEWKKFSRRLDSRQRSTLAVLVPDRDPQAASRVRGIASRWKAEGFADSLVRDAVRDIAFEVYVEQEVPDCH